MLWRKIALIVLVVTSANASPPDLQQILNLVLQGGVERNQGQDPEISGTGKSDTTTTTTETPPTTTTPNSTKVEKAEITNKATPTPVNTEPATVNSGGTNTVVLPPTISVDIVNLLRWVIHEEISKVQHRGGGDKEQVATEAPTPPPVILPPQPPYSRDFLNLTQLGDKEYFFCTNQRMSYIEAMYFCRAHGMDLISIESKEEQEMIVEHITTLGATGKNFFLSAHQIGRPDFLWLNGAPLNYTNWNAGRQPREPDFEHCVVLNNLYTWSDFPCVSHGARDWDAYFICEHDLPE